jgi:hypothetical protein
VMIDILIGLFCFTVRFSAEIDMLSLNHIPPNPHDVAHSTSLPFYGIPLIKSKPTSLSKTQNSKQERVFDQQNEQKSLRSLLKDAILERSAAW